LGQGAKCFFTRLGEKKVPIAIGKPSYVSDEQRRLVEKDKANWS